MIRRNIQLADGTRAWLLVSQVAHARISGEMAAAWRETFSPEVIEAIAHHDDGWSEWEAAPTLDTSGGRPLSFLEMPIDAAIQIWDRSILSARQIGPLAGAIVAGHFIGLASGSEQAAHPTAAKWLHEMAVCRAAWLDEWRRMSSINTPKIADAGQRMLLTADLLSLYLCCDGPVASVDADEIPNAEMKSRTDTVLGRYQFDERAKTIAEDRIDWQGTLSPWPFAVREIVFTSSAIAALVKKYGNWLELATESWPVELRWQLRETLPPRDEC